MGVSSNFPEDGLSMKGILLLGLFAPLLSASVWAVQPEPLENGGAALAALMFSKRSFEESRWCFYGSQIVGKMAEARMAGKTKDQAEKMLGPNLPEKLQEAVDDAFSYSQPGPDNVISYFTQCLAKAEDTVRRDIDELGKSSG